MIALPSRTQLRSTLLVVASLLATSCTSYGGPPARGDASTLDAASLDSGPIDLGADDLGAGDAAMGTATDGGCFENTDCADGSICTASGARLECVPQCGESLTYCVGAGGGTSDCVDLMQDPNNCGSCGRECGPNVSCISGNCDPLSSDAGTRDAAAPACGTRSCSSDGAIITVNTCDNADHCGSCGNECGQFAECCLGECSDEPCE